MFYFEIPREADRPSAPASASACEERGHEAGERGSALGHEGADRGVWVGTDQRKSFHRSPVRPMGKEIDRAQGRTLVVAFSDFERG